MKSLTVADVNEIICLSRFMSDNKKRGIKSEFDFLQSPEEKKLYTKVKSLSSSSLAELCALMWLGREAGGGQVSDWQKLVVSAKSQKGDEGILYITSKSPLARYLENGLKIKKTI